MIRILQFADVINRHDFIDTIVRNADTHRFEVGVCVRTADFNIADPGYPDSVPRWVLGGLSRTHIPFTAWRLARLLKAWQTDILHVHHYDQAVIGMLATRLFRRTRLVVGRHYSDAIYRSTNGVKQKALLAIESNVNRSATRIVVPSTAIAELMIGQQKVPSEKVVVVPYAFEAAKYPAAIKTEAIRNELAPPGAFIIGNFARLHEEKGQRYLIEAVAKLHQRLTNLRCVIVGEGPERSALERQIQKAGLNNVVQLLGWRRDAMNLMAALDAVVQPTLQEAFSQVMVESMWMGKPLVMTTVSGATDIISDGFNGILVRPSDPEALAQAIERLATDADLGTQMGAAGRAFVEQNLTAKKVLPRYEAVYEQIMAERP